MPSSSLPHGAIIVMGVSGAGKTTLAQALAATLGCAFIEGDSLHPAPNVEKMRAGQPLSDADRWPWLDLVGTALRDAIATQRVAMAACSALKQSYRDRLRSAVAAPVHFILLQAPHAELEQRMKQRSGHYMPASLLASQLATLETPTAAEQVLVLDARLPLHELQQASLAWLRSAA